MSTATLTRPTSTYASPQIGRSLVRRQTQQDDGGNSLAFTRTSRRKSKKRTTEMVRKVPPPLIQKVGLAAQVYGIQGIMGTVMWLQGWREWLYPPGSGRGGPDIVKAYEARPGMPVRIFFPASYDLTSPQELPTILSIHGGGFCIGTSRDDDEWNRNFADSQNMLVVSLPYQMAPRAPFPTALQDLEALYLSVLGDESLPIDRTSSNSNNTRFTTSAANISENRRAKGRVCLVGFDAGGNLALALGQLAGVRNAAVPPTAVVSICGYLDLERPMASKLQNRPYKPTALSRPRNHGPGADPLAATYPAYVWSYVPYGHDLRDPLLSPAFASWDGAAYREEEASSAVITTNGGRGGLPPHVCLVGAELDVLAHESWRLACRLVRDGGIARGDGRTGRWRVPDPDAEGDELQSICGRKDPAPAKGRLEVLEEEMKTMFSTTNRSIEDGMDGRKRFGFEVRWKGSSSSSSSSSTNHSPSEAEAGEGNGSVKWILVPDVMHGFDRGWWISPGMGGVLEETVRDAKLKTVAYIDSVGTWLRGTVWEIEK